MRKIFLLAMLLMAFMMTGCGSDSNTIKIGIDDQYAPLGFRNDNGEIVGFDVDLAKEVARRMSVKIKFVPIDWYDKEEEIISGNVDMIWNGLDITDKRKEYMTFSKPYMDNRQILMVKKGDGQDIHSEYDLEGKIVATQAGSNSEEYISLNDDLKKSFAAFKTYRNVQDGFKSLSKGEYDVLIIDELAARYEVLLHPSTFEIIETTIGPLTEIAIGFRKDNVELRDKIQDAFDEMIQDGTAKKISEQWFQADLIKLKRK